MSTKYCLGHKTARKLHTEIINSPNAYSLTLTLKPYYNSLPLYEQHRMMEESMKQLFKKLNRHFNKVMYTPEVTKQHNIHYHCYIVLPEGVSYVVFEQNFKKSRTKKGSIGANYKFKEIDEVTDILNSYPFKDIARTTSYAAINGCLFNPSHTFLNGLNSWKII